MEKNTWPVSVLTCELEFFFSNGFEKCFFYFSNYFTELYCRKTEFSASQWRGFREGVFFIISKNRKRFSFMVKFIETRIQLIRISFIYWHPSNFSWFQCQRIKYWFIDIDWVSSKSWTRKDFSWSNRFQCDWVSRWTRNCIEFYEMNTTSGSKNPISRRLSDIVLPLPNGPTTTARRECSINGSLEQISMDSTKTAPCRWLRRWMLSVSLYAIFIVPQVSPAFIGSVPIFFLMVVRMNGWNGSSITGPMRLMPVRSITAALKDARWVTHTHTHTHTKKVKRKIYFKKWDK